MRNGTRYLLLLIAVSVFAGGCSKPKPGQEKNKESQKVTAEKKDQYRMDEAFQGNKDQIIDLIEGPATFDIKYEGNSTFSARLLNNQGDLIEILAEVTGPYKGTKTITVPKTASYILEVKTTGTWSVYRK